MFIICTNNIVNGHLHLYFSPSANLILFLKIISDRMSSINILESLGTISPIKISREWIDAQSCIWMCLCNQSKVCLEHIILLLTSYKVHYKLLLTTYKVDYKITDLLQSWLQKLLTWLQKLLPCYKANYKNYWLVTKLITKITDLLTSWLQTITNPIQSQLQKLLTCCKVD